VRVVYDEPIRRELNIRLAVYYEPIKRELNSVGVMRDYKLKKTYMFIIKR
jgi:hypothetical protein